jgi:hypothetical protein
LQRLDFKPLFHPLVVLTVAVVAAAPTHTRPPCKMQRAQRTFGRFLKRAPNEADVEAMLTDFTDSEQMLEKVCPVGIPITAAIWVVAQA